MWWQLRKKVCWITTPRARQQRSLHERTEDVAGKDESYERLGTLYFVAPN